MKNFLAAHLTQIATYATIIVIFTHNALFDREVACTCKDQKLHCNLYISLPIFIIFLLLLWKDKNFNGACRAYWGMKTRSEANFCCVILIQMGKASVMGLLWVVSVLFDGDWYACCHNGLPTEKAQIPCKTSRSLEEQATIDHLKNESKIIGLFILLGLFFLVVCFSLLKWCNCCKECSSCSDFCKKCQKCSDFCKNCQKCSDNCKKCQKCSDNCKKCQKCSDNCKKCQKCSHCCRKCLSYSDGDAPYELIIIQEEENVVNQILKERAKEALREKVQEILETEKTNKYMNCYDAAQQVIYQEWPEENQGSSAGGTAPASDQPSGSETHEDVWKLTGNVTITHSSGEKGPGPSTSGDPPSGSEAETHKDGWQLTGNVSLTCSPGEKIPLLPRNQDYGATGRS